MKTTMVLVLVWCGCLAALAAGVGDRGRSAKPLQATDAKTAEIHSLWTAEEWTQAAMLTRSSYWTDFECMPVETGDGLCWTVDDVEMCVGEYSIVESRIDWFGDRSIAPSRRGCLDDSPPPLLLTFNPPVTNLNFVASRSDAGELWAAFWMTQDAIGDESQAIILDNPGEDAMGWGVGMSSGITAIAFHAEAVDQIIVFVSE